MKRAESLHAAALSSLGALLVEFDLHLAPLLASELGNILRKAGCSWIAMDMRHMQVQTGRGRFELEAWMGFIAKP